MNQHCGKHDKVFTEDNPCPGCENEKAGVYVSSAQQSLEDSKPVEEVENGEENGEENSEEENKGKGKRKRR